MLQYFSRLLLLAMALGLASCVNEAKNPSQVQDSLSQLTILYNASDSNALTSVAFHASMKPQMKPNYRLDWNFGDSTGIISQRDTSALVHDFKYFGSYVVSLSVIDTQTKVTIGKTSVNINLLAPAIDTNYLHTFHKIKIELSGVYTYKLSYPGGNRVTTDTGSVDYLQGFPFLPDEPITWSGYSFFGHDTTSHTSVTSGGSLMDSNYWNYSGSILGTQLNATLHYRNFIDDYDYHVGTYQFDDERQALVFQSLPLHDKSAKNLVFKLSGPGLESKIMNLSYYLKSIEGLERNILGMSWNDQIQPVLTITFY